MGDWRAARGLDRALVMTLAEGRWIDDAINLLITGATGAGKTWIACAFGHRACRIEPKGDPRRKNNAKIRRRT